MLEDVIQGVQWVRLGHGLGYPAGVVPVAGFGQDDRTFSISMANPAWRHPNLQFDLLPGGDFHHSSHRPQLDLRPAGSCGHFATGDRLKGP